MRWAVSCAPVLALLLGAEEAMAGQLMIDDFGLKEVAADIGWVYIGTIAGPFAKGETQLAVRRIYLLPGKSEPSAREGQTIKIGIYQGIKWTNPRKSPIDRRLRGAIGAGKVGDEVIAVSSGGSFELLPATPRNLQKVEVFFVPEAQAKYAESEEAKLGEDLADPDLAELALAALKKRGPIKATYLIDADFQLLRGNWESADPQTRKQFLQALPKNKATAERVLDLVEYKLAIAPIADVAPFLDHLQGRTLGDMHLAMVIAANEENKCAPGSFSPLDRFLIRYEKERPDHKSSDEDFEKFRPCFDAPSLCTLWP